MGSGASRERLPEHLEALLSPVVSAVDLDLEKVEVTPAGRRRVLRVVIDRDGGIGLDEVTAASHAISAALDSSDVMGATPYVLEVTSPGVDRPLTAERHWRRATARLVRAELAGGEVVVGRVLEAGEADAVLEVAGSPRRLGYADVTAARVLVVCSRAGAVAPDDDPGEDDSGDEIEPDDREYDSGEDDSGDDDSGEEGG
jgi:ribosome maturation factor RimP